MESKQAHVVWSEGDSYGYYGDVFAVFDSFEEAKDFISKEPEWRHYEIKSLPLNNGREEKSPGMISSLKNRNQKKKSFG